MDTRATNSRLYIHSFSLALVRKCFLLVSKIMICWDRFFIRLIILFRIFLGSLFANSIFLAALNRRGVENFILQQTTQAANVSTEKKMKLASRYI